MSEAFSGVDRIMELWNNVTFSFPVLTFDKITLINVLSFNLAKPSTVIRDIKNVAILIPMNLNGRIIASMKLSLSAFDLYHSV